MAEKAFAMDCRINIRCGDDKLSMQIRRGVLETRPWHVDGSHAMLTLSRTTLRELVENLKDLAGVLGNNELVVEQGDKNLLAQVEGLFEPSSGGNFPVALPSALKIF